MSYKRSQLGELATIKGGKRLPKGERLPIALPTEAFIGVFQSIVEPMNRLANSLREKNEILRQTRDFLLPKLIPGELDISHLSIEINE